jgi:RND family efflux transporter MFP subunit
MSMIDKQDGNMNAVDEIVLAQNISRRSGSAPMLRRVLSFRGALRAKVARSSIPEETENRGPKLMRLVAPALLAMTLVALATGCEHRAVQQRPPLAQVTVAPVERKEIVEWDEFTGRIEPIESVEVRPRVSGYIQEVRFQSGQLVKKGDVLFVIDPRWHQATFDQRQAEFEQAKVHLENAKHEADRSSQLLADKAISVEESDARQSRYQAAKAAWLAAQAALESAKLDLDYTQVRAPVDGRVSRALLTDGNYISGVAGAASLLTTIVSVDPVYVYADIDENSLLKFDALIQSRKLETNADGRVPVDVQLADETDFPHRGYLESLNNRVDANTGSILLRAIVPNPEGRMVPGLFARIRLPLSERYQALLVEERAVGTDQAQKFVLTLTSSNTVAYQTVKLGPAMEGKRVVRSGLQGTEEIVVNGLQRVRPGMPVVPQQEMANQSDGHLANR